jgi:hypothetical protein
MLETNPMVPGKNLMRRRMVDKQHSLKISMMKMMGIVDKQQSFKL